MDLTGFVDVNVKDKDAIQQFFDLHALVHQTENNAMLTLGYSIPVYPLWTDGVADKDWLLIHAGEHRARDVALALGTTPDLDSVDFGNPDDAAVWFYNHRLQHALEDQSLGL